MIGYNIVKVHLMVGAASRLQPEYEYALDECGK